MPDDEPSKNPFVRWKQHVDAHIGFTLNGLLGIPSMVTRNLHLGRHDGQSREAENAGSPNACDCGRDAAAPASRADDELDEFHRWMDFIQYSPYSPLNLRALPQPIPRDVPAGVDAYGFTFTDAFEDLLAASAGRRLMDLRQREYLNYQKERLFRGPEPSPSWFFRLHSEGLLGGFFPPPSSTPRQQHKPEEAREERPVAPEEVGDSWIREAAKAFREPEARSDVPSHRRGEAGALFDELDRAFTTLGRIVEEDANAASSRLQGKATDEAGTEEDAYAALQSAFRSSVAESGRSWNAFMRAFSEGRFGLEGSTSASTPETPSPDNGETPEAEQMGRTVKSTEEHVDVFGMRHVKTVVKRLNADGDEVSREVHYSVRSDSRPRRVEDFEKQEQQAAGEEQQPRDAQSRKKSGWFWR